MKKGIKKKVLAVLCAVGIAAGLLSGCSSSQTSDSGSSDSATSDQPYAGQTVTICAWGGSYETTLREKVIPEFEEKTGAKVEIVLGSAPIAQLKTEGDNPSVDVLHMTIDEVTTGEQMGVLEKIDSSKLTNAGDLYSEAFENSYAVVTNWGTWGLAYNADETDAPTSWKDLWDAKYAGGKVAIDDVDFAGAYELAEMTAQVFFNTHITDPSCWDEVFAKLQELTPNVGVIASEHADVDNALLSGECIVGLHTNGRTLALIQAGNTNIKFSKPEEGMPAMTTYAGIAANSQHKELAYMLLDDLLGATAQEAYMTNNFYAPANKTVTIPDEYKDYMPSTEEEVSKLINIDLSTISDQKADFVERWNKVFK